MVIFYQGTLQWGGSFDIMSARFAQVIRLLYSN